MMLGDLSRVHAMSAALWMSDTCAIEGYDETGTWGVRHPVVRVQVQTPRASESTSDPDDATGTEKAMIVAYIPDRYDVKLGDRVMWGGMAWEVNAIPVRSARHVQALRCSVDQTALVPEQIQFVRRVAGQSELLGVFTVRFTERPPLRTSSDTAEGSTMQAVMIGGVETVDLQPGDWFSRDGLPGRVLRVDATVPTHVEIEYLMETEHP